MNEKVINEMNEYANKLHNHATNELGHFLVFDVKSGEYDKPRTSYIIEINAFGFVLQVIYSFDENTVVVYDTTKNRDIFKVDVTNDFDLYYLFMIAIWEYSLILHAADSSNYFEVL